MAGGSIFARIIAGEIPCHRIYETPAVLAFLDVNPLAPGHALVLPKRSVARLEELRDEEGAQLGAALVAVTRKIMAVTGAAGCNILLNNGAVANQEVQHVHFHIIPRAAEDGLGYRWKPQARPATELADLAKRLLEA